MADAASPNPSEAVKERRRLCRRNVVDRQMVTVELGGGRTGILIDVSEEGMGVQPFLPIAIGTELDFSFDLPRGAGRVTGKGSVQSSVRTGRIGVRFRELSERSSDNLASWLKITRDPFTPAIDEQPAQAEPEPVAVSTTAGTQGPDDLDAATALAMVVERARGLTRADGAALIIATPAGFVCHASAGEAPQPGTPAPLDSSLTGECLRLGVTVTCADSKADSRVNPIARDLMGVRSVVVVPVLNDSRISGALEVLAKVPDAFTERHVSHLEQLADIASGVLSGDGFVS